MKKTRGKNGIIAAFLLLVGAVLFALPDAQVDGIQAVKQWANTRINEGRQDYNSTGLTRMASPGFWGAEIVYQIQVDRFNNGDINNDNLNIKAFQADHQNTADLWELHEYRHGGDLQGVIDRLDYLADLGITALWLTPVLKHDGSYHGYVTTDFTEVDPGFGSKELLRELVAQAHARGIKVVLDIVVNHMGDPNTYYSAYADHYGAANDLSAKNWNGESGGSSRQGQLHFGDTFFGPFKSQYFFNRCGTNSHDDMTGTGPASIYGDFVAEMFDLDTRNYDFQQIFTDLHKYWIAYADIDGYRMDAAKHITEDFIAYFCTQIRDYAKSIGKDNFYIVGEVAGPSDWQGRTLGTMFSNPYNPDQHGIVPQTLTNRLWTIKDIYLSHGKANYPGLNGVYDFIHSGTAREMLLGTRSTNSLEQYFYSSNYATLAAQNDPRLCWNVLEIHDWPRFVKYNKDDEWKSKLGLSYLACAQGIPVIYYGMEQGFNGDGHYDNVNVGAARDQILGVLGTDNHALYRQDMFISGPWRLGSTVDQINNLAYIGKTTPSVWEDWTTDPFLNRQHEVYKTARKFNYIRRSSNALRYGRTVFRWGSTSNQGITAFSRIDGNQEVVVIVNNSPYDQSIPNLQIDPAINAQSGHKYRNLLNSYQIAWTGRENGTSYLYFHGMMIKGNSVMVFVHENNMTGYNTYLETHLVKDNPVSPR